jgi:hypothetical protein
MRQKLEYSTFLKDSGNSAKPQSPLVNKTLVGSFSTYVEYYFPLFLSSRVFFSSLPHPEVGGGSVNRFPEAGTPGALL